MGEPDHSATEIPAPLIETPEHRSTLLRMGGTIGFAAATIGILLFLIGCAGYGAAFRLSMIPVGLGAFGLVLSLVAGLTARNRLSDGTQVLAGVFTGVLGLLSGLCEMAIWLNWQMLGK